ncbi:hypothetical protein Taro_050415 [Colocasia esculenta]|uniref:Retrotransposon gag domain-containing protein n=1 Tax=Colocasia esculenta TaxID=4460 RepID=A0A843XDC7_COLES|nr:hypothetical protein [Colocasia esculenta]
MKLWPKSKLASTWMDVHDEPTSMSMDANTKPWLREVGVVVYLLVMASRGEMSLGVRSRLSSRPRHLGVLYFPHHRQWIMECSCRERADVWWASLLRTRFEDGAIDVAWDEFVRLFRAKFIPEHIQDKMEQEFLSLIQGSMTVLEYEARFAELSKYAPHIVTDERKKAKKFVMGLKPSLRTRLVAFDHRTLDEALSVACRQEGEMQQYLEEKKASQKRPAATFQRQDKKKTVYQALQRPVTTSSAHRKEGVSSLREDTRWFRVLDDCGKVLEVRKQRPQDQELSETSAGSPARSASPSSGRSSSASYRKTTKASSPSSSVCPSTRGCRSGGACH